MKAIPTSVKAQFFAMYYNQIVLSYPNQDGGPDLAEGGLIDMTRFGQLNEWYLELRQSSDLTDEEAIVLNFFGASNVKNCLESYGWDQFVELFINKPWKVDYLRSIGIILPFSYLNNEKKPVTLSVDELIGMNWAVIKK